MVAGLCDVCNKPSTHLNTCWRCGARVCDEHFDKKTGLCVRCVRGTVYEV